MINAKTAKRVGFAMDYEGQDFEENKQLKFMLAKSIEPEEIRHKLHKARVVQQEIIMHTEGQSQYLDQDTYAALMPGVFRREHEKGFKKQGRETPEVDGQNIRKVLQEKIAEERKKVYIDVRKGTGQVSYMKFFKPPKPIQQNPDQVSSQQTMTAYHKRLIESEGKNRLIHGIESSMKSKMSTQKHGMEMFDMLSKSLGIQLQNQNQSKKEDEKANAPLDSQELKFQPSKGYKYYSRKGEIESSTSEDDIEEHHQNNNLLMRSYEEPTPEKLFKAQQQRKLKNILKMKEEKRDKDINKVSEVYVNKGLDYDHDLDKIKKEIHELQKNHKSRNQALDNQPIFPNIGQRNNGRTGNASPSLNASLHKSGIMKSTNNTIMIFDQNQTMQNKQTMQSTLANTSVFNTQYLDASTIKTNAQNSLQNTQSKTMFQLNTLNTISLNNTLQQTQTNQHDTSTTLNATQSGQKSANFMLNMFQSQNKPSSNSLDFLSDIKSKIPQIRLKSLKKTHDDYEREKQERLNKVGHQVMMMMPEQRDFFINQNKGGNKNYRLANAYDNEVVILKPQFDASDKEIFKRNGMSSAAEQLKSLINTKERLIQKDTTFVPQQFGQISDPKEYAKRVVKNNTKFYGDENDQDIIIKRQVDTLFQKLGPKLLYNTTNLNNMKMNLNLREYFGDLSKIHLMSMDEREKIIRQYLYDRIKLSAQNEEPLLDKIEEKKESDDDDYELAKKKKLQEEEELQCMTIIKPRLREKPKPTIIMKNKNQKPRKKYIPPSEIIWRNPAELNEKGKNQYEIDSEDSDYKANMNDPQKLAEKQGFKFKLLSEKEQIAEIERNRLKAESRLKKFEKFKQQKKQVIKLVQQDNMDLILKEREERENRQIKKMQRKLEKEKMMEKYNQYGENDMTSESDDDEYSEELNLEEVKQREELLKQIEESRQKELEEEQEKMKQEFGSFRQSPTFKRGKTNWRMDKDLQPVTIQIDGELLTPKKTVHGNSSVLNGSQTKKNSFVKLESGSVLKKKKRSKLEKESKHFDVIIQNENQIIERVRSILESNLKNSVGPGMSKSFASLTESQEKDSTSHYIDGMMNPEYKLELLYFKKQMENFDDLFLSKNGVKVKPERKKRPIGEVEITKNMTEFERIEEHKRKMRDLQLFDIDREIMKHKIHMNREFFRELENPVNDVEEAVNENIKIEMKKRHKEQKRLRFDFKPTIIKKLPLIDDMKFSNMQIRSLAEKKRIWKGKKKGVYKPSDILKWFKVYEETKLYEIRNMLGKEQENEYRFLQQE